MEMRKMEKNKENKKVEKVEIVKRKDYKELVNFLVENKDLENKEIVKENYEKRFKLRFSNIERLIKRSMRIESRKNLLENLEKEKIEIGEYLKISYKVINLSKNKKNNLIEVELIKK